MLKWSDDLDILGWFMMIWGTPHFFFGKAPNIRNIKPGQRNSRLGSPCHLHKVCEHHKGCFEMFCSHGNVSIFSPFYFFSSSRGQLAGIQGIKFGRCWLPGWLPAFQCVRCVKFIVCLILWSRLGKVTGPANTETVEFCFWYPPVN